MGMTLVILFTAYSYGATTLQIKGFSTYASCEKAKVVILRQLQPRVRNDEVLKAVCIQVK